MFLVGSIAIVLGSIGFVAALLNFWRITKKAKETRP